MALNNASKMKKEISEYIVAHVLDHSDILIRGSQKRQNYDNEMRQELWTNLANKLAEVFDTPMEPEKVKQHFHNRRKAVMGRVRDDLKRHAMDGATVDEKMDWIKNRRVVVNDNDLQIIEYFFNKEQDRDTTPAPTGVPVNVPVVTTTEFDTSAMNFLNGLVKTDGSKCEGEVTAQEEDVEEETASTEPIEQTETLNLDLFNNPHLLLPTPKPALEEATQLIVEVQNKSELKRLLTLLNFGIKSFGTLKKACSKRKANGEHVTARRGQNGMGDIPENFASLLNSQDGTDALLLGEGADLNTTANLLFEMAKFKTDENEAVEDDDELNISSSALVDLVKSFGIPETKKKVSSDGISLKCELCRNVVRLNQSGSKWNLYEHVVLNHSTHRPYKCTKCSYSGVRRGRVRQHILTAHESDDQPENVATPDIREVWENKMLQCFPNHKQIKGTFPTLS